MTAPVIDLACARLQRQLEASADYELLLGSARYLEMYAALHGNCGTKADIKAHAQGLREKARRMRDEHAG